jgi:arginine/ornithine N-succinyltransferase beta subunit
VHASRTLKVNNRVHVLNICHDLTGMVQLCGFYADTVLEPLAAELLSRARLLFIASARQRFGRRIIAEMQGIHDDAGSRHSGTPLAAASSIWISCRWNRLLSATAKPSLPS